VKVLQQQAQKLQADIDSATLKSPINGVVMTKDLDLREGEVLQQGAPFAEIDDLGSWQLQAQINERDISTVEEAFQKSGSLDLTYILYSQSAHTLHARVDNLQQISASAYPQEKDNVFLITVDKPDIPADIIADMRPGLSGRAKLELGREMLIVTLARNFYRWCQFRMIG
jgi:multidrug efflux pump subunit AcrA (membrane-fusion protein)